MCAVSIGYYISKRFKKSTNKFSVYFATNALPLLRTSLLALYFFVVLHKLNYDFFKTDISCGAVLFENLLNNLKLINIGFIDNFYSTNQSLIANFSIYFSLCAELTIPILLLFKGSRNLGLILGLLFHFLLGLEGLGAIVSFTAMMFTYLVLFSSDALVAKALETIKNFKRYFIIGFTITTLLIAISLGFLSHNIFNKVVGLVWVIYTLITIGFYIKNIRLKSENTLRLNSEYLIFWMFPLLVVLNGFAPYLGLKTQTSFSMFSNLITENGKTNHFFIPSELQIFDYQREIVIIKDTNMKNLSSSDTWNQDKAYNFLLFEFIKKVETIDEGYVSFEVNDKPYYIEKKNGKVTTSSIKLNQNKISRKLLLFRPIYSDNISYCQQ